MSFEALGIARTINVSNTEPRVGQERDQERVRRPDRHEQPQPSGGEGDPTTHGGDAHAGTLGQGLHDNAGVRSG